MSLLASFVACLAAGVVGFALGVGSAERRMLKRAARNIRPVRDVGGGYWKS